MSGSRVSSRAWPHGTDPVLYTHSMRSLGRCIPRTGLRVHKATCAHPLSGLSVSDRPLACLSTPDEWQPIDVSSAAAPHQSGPLGALDALARGVHPEDGFEGAQGDMRTSIDGFERI